jgi:GDPmannose 4,6-dehydratase
MSRGNPGKARQELGWEAKFKMNDVVRMMIDAQDGQAQHK